MSNHDEPGCWEDYGFNNSFVSLKNAKAGDSWEGWYTGKQESQMGESIHLKSKIPGQPKIVFPLTGMLRVILERDFKLYDYIKLIYKGQVKLEKGKWAGKMSHDFDVKKAVDFSGEMNMYRRLGQPIPDHLRAHAVTPPAEGAPAHAPMNAAIPTGVEADFDNIF
jgi:hypothetical protein